MEKRKPTMWSLTESHLQPARTTDMNMNNELHDTDKSNNHSIHCNQESASDCAVFGLDISRRTINICLNSFVFLGGYQLKHDTTATLLFNQYFLCHV